MSKETRQSECRTCSGSVERAVARSLGIELVQHAHISKTHSPFRPGSVPARSASHARGNLPAHGAGSRLLRRYHFTATLASTHQHSPAIAVFANEIGSIQADTSPNLPREGGPSSPRSSSWLGFARFGLEYRERFAPGIYRLERTCLQPSRSRCPQDCAQGFVPSHPLHAIAMIACLQMRIGPMRVHSGLSDPRGHAESSARR